MLFSLNAIPVGVGLSSARVFPGERKRAFKATARSSSSKSRFRAVNDPSGNTSTLHSFSNKNGARSTVNALHATKARGRGSSTHGVVVLGNGVKCCSSKSSSSTSDDSDDEEKEEKE